MDKILILDFGSQVTQLIGRRLRECNVFCEIFPYNKMPQLDGSVRGVILSGSPCSVRDANAPQVDLSRLRGRVPLLGICYGAQYLAQQGGGMVEGGDSREYGRAVLRVVAPSPLLRGVKEESTVWMSHGDSIARLPRGAKVIASTPDVVNAAFQFEDEPTYAVQFHPEVYHSEEGARILENFAHDICRCKGDWTPDSFIGTTVEQLRRRLGGGKVILGLSGGVDSTVAAVLLNKAVGNQLTCIFVNNGLLRKGEYEAVLASYRDMGLQVIGADASAAFLAALKGVTDPEAKRKAIGRLFVETFEHYARQIDGARYLAQGTIYPDVIESAGIPGIASKIKSHHNVGGLPDVISFDEIAEPLKDLFKDEVRELGTELGLPEEMVWRQPFPGPGLGIRVLGEITEEKLQLVRDSDAILREEIRKAGLHREIWQYFTCLPDIHSVGVMGDQRTYDYTVVVRAVTSIDGMTADWARIPYDVLDRISTRIVNEVAHVNRVALDITSKPPGTIEWE